MTVLQFPVHPVPDDPFYLTKLEEDDREPELIHYGEDELSPEEYEQVLEDQAATQRIMDGLEALGFATATINLDSLPMAMVPDSELGLD